MLVLDIFSAPPINLVLDDESRQTSLVCITGIAGVVAYIGALFAYGVIERHDGDFLGEVQPFYACCFRTLALLFPRWR